MNLSIEQLKAQLADYEAKCGMEEPVSILEFFWNCYRESKAVDDGLIMARERAMDPIYEELSTASADILFDMIYDLFEAYQRAALLEGIQIGFHLADELIQR